MVDAKRLALNFLSSDRVARLFYPLMSGRAAIFMLHRFQCPDVGLDGHDLRFLRTVLQYLRDQRYELLSLRDLYARLDQPNATVDRAVAFTIDDGYFDHAIVAAPIFAEFDCPVTTFVTTGFLEGQLWFWWDKIDYIFESTTRSSVTMTMGRDTLRYAWTSARERNACQEGFTQWCKTRGITERLDAVTLFAVAAEVGLPPSPPRRYAPMSWEQLSTAEKLGMEFGPHTITHPILAQASAEQASEEIGQSWKTLQKHASRPVPVFCYPNGQLTDFSRREMTIVREVGMVGAVSGEPGYFECPRLRGSADDRYQVRRFAFPNNMADFVQYVSGMERAKQVLRREP